MQQPRWGRLCSSSTSPTSACTEHPSPAPSTSACPTARPLANWCLLVQHLVDSGDAELVDGELSGPSQQRFVARRPADLSVFTADQLSTIDRVLDDLAGMTAAEVSALSREEAAWRHIDDGDTIPYHLAFVPKEQVLTPTARRLGAEVARRYQLADSG